MNERKHKVVVAEGRLRCLTCSAWTLPHPSRKVIRSFSRDHPDPYAAGPRRAREDVQQHLWRGV